MRWWWERTNTSASMRVRARLRSKRLRRLQPGHDHHQRLDVSVATAGHTRIALAFCFPRRRHLQLYCFSLFQSRGPVRARSGAWIAFSRPLETLFPGEHDGGQRARCRQDFVATGQTSMRSTELPQAGRPHPSLCALTSHGHSSHITLAPGAIANALPVPRCKTRPCAIAPNPNSPHTSGGGLARCDTGGREAPAVDRVLTSRAVQYCSGSRARGRLWASGFGIQDIVYCKDCISV